MTPRLGLRALRRVPVPGRWNSTLVDAPITSDPVPLQQSIQAANKKKIFEDAAKATAPRNSWTREEISAIYYQPLMELTYQAVSEAASPSSSHSNRAQDMSLL